MNRIVGLRVGVILGMALIPAASHWTGYAQQASGPGVVDPVSGATGKEFHVAVDRPERRAPSLGGWLADGPA
jgi:hypothetical protein